MKVSTIFIIILFISALFVSIAGTSYYYTSSVKVAEENIYFHLKSVAQSRAHHVITFLEQKNKAIQQLSASVAIEELLLIDKSNPEYSNKLNRVNKRLLDTLNLFDSFYEVFVLDKQGKVAATTNPEEEIGTDFSDDLLFLNAKTKTYMSDLCYDEEFDRLGFVSCSPIYDEESNNFLGVVVIRLNSEILNYITMDKTGLGETGETYLINKDYYPITPLLFMEDVILSQRVNTINSRNCLELPTSKHIGHEPVEIFLNYQGEKVIGSYFYIQEQGWCLLAEMDEQEILGKQKRLFQKVALTIILYLTIIIPLIGFFLSKLINKNVSLKKGKKRL